jgi:hypothetical protein
MNSIYMFCIGILHIILQAFKYIYALPFSTTTAYFSMEIKKINTIVHDDKQPPQPMLVPPRRSMNGLDRS